MNERWVWLRRDVWVLVAAGTSIVIVVAAVRGIARGFEPVGDNALVDLRAWDLFSRHRPWLGTWSSASQSGGDVNHPGPLLFDLFAVPVRVFGRRWGVAGGAAVLNVAAVWTAALTARRFGGPRVALAVTIAAAALVWSVGSELLYDVWMPHIVVLPCFALLVAVWGVLAGHPWMLVTAVVAASFCTQVHGSYLLLGPGLVLLAFGVVLFADRAARARNVVRPVVVALGAGLLLWIQPLVEQVAGAGEGNLSRLLGSSSGGDRHGLGLAVRIAAAALAVPPAWLRPGFRTAIPNTTLGDRPPTELDTSGLPSGPLALVALVVVGAVFVVVIAAAARRGDRWAAPGLVVVGTAVVLGLVTISITPLDLIGLSGHKFRWWWAIGPFAAATAAAALAGVVGSPRPGWRRPLTGVGLGVAAALSAATIPVYRPSDGFGAAEAAWPEVRAIREQLGALEDVGVVYFDLRGQWFAEPYSWPIMAEMAHRGIEFRVVREGDVRQVGDARRLERPADARVFFRVGDEAALEVTPDGGTRIAYAPGDPALAVFVAPFDPADAAETEW